MPDVFEPSSNSLNNEPLGNEPLGNEAAEPVRANPSATLSATSPASSQSVELLGAVDIVEAFTALRHELKLQVRSGRETQQALSDGLQKIEQKIEQRMAAAQTATSAGSADGRKFAEAIADIDESLQRAVESLISSFSSAKGESTRLTGFDAAVKQAPWLARKFASSIFSDLRKILEQVEQESRAAENSRRTMLQGFELLVARMRRQMQQCEIERIDVVGKAFDAEYMNAIDMIDAPKVAKSHVAEQLRPAYLWRGNLLRCADVRLAK